MLPHISLSFNTNEWYFRCVDEHGFTFPTYPLNSAGDYCGKQKHGKCESNSFLTSIKFALYGFVAVASAFFLLVVQKVI
jgi:hypothetical protein